MRQQGRLFFALWPDDAVRHALLHWQTQNLSSNVRWQHRADFHLTLHFLGRIEAPVLPELVKLGASAPRVGFGIVLDEVGHWARPQVLWCGPSSPGASLAELHRYLGDRLPGIGLTPETRPFKPHVTLARNVKSPPDHRPLAPISWAVREWALVASVPGPAPHYRCIHRWPLT